ncbi:hypothetical protein K461DRAFT_9415 [Myriangium duriaei CBS 260.36]|uniref:Uncharacterized protein n=1 Tax=Myriangium duriaei CBS 260.36 TaxID=1168546 RepID=A0A9P4JDU5_9PEZI|nr:hypothetical protein K461DRAFT_9415 [Myriangium duriaei CBS 260.36]
MSNSTGCTTSTTMTTSTKTFMTTSTLVTTKSILEDFITPCHGLYGSKTTSYRRPYFKQLQPPQLYGNDGKHYL